MNRVVLGLGANLADRLATMRAAVAAIRAVGGVEVVARSRVYETAPVGGVAQPDFLNAALLVECTLSPLRLLDELLRIERELGRDRTKDAVRWGPRAIDLDVLWIEDLVVDDARLVVPHPRLVERAFALLPLLEVAPDAPFVAPASHDDVRMTSLTL
jgi:2-amino-4-hydroxy-6-hydroxymethyldihydropteridine diphosphokinase